MGAMLPVYLYCLDFPNGKKYVGLSTNPNRRLREHYRQAAAKTGGYPVHAAIRMHGMPRLRKLCVGNIAYIAELEIKAIAAFQTRNPDFGYNVALGGDLSPSVVPDVAAKIGVAQKSARNIAHLARLSAARRGQKMPPPSPEARAKQSAAQRGKTRGPMPPEQRANISAAKKGRPLGPMSLERRARMSAAHMGKPGTRNGMTNSPEARAKMSVALTGKKHTPEHRANHSAAIRANAVKRRNHTSSIESVQDVDASHSDLST